MYSLCTPVFSSSILNVSPIWQEGIRYNYTVPNHMAHTSLIQMISSQITIILNKVSLCKFDHNTWWIHDMKMTQTAKAVSKKNCTTQSCTLLLPGCWPLHHDGDGQQNALSSQPFCQTSLSILPTVKSLLICPITGVGQPLRNLSHHATTAW